MRSPVAGSKPGKPLLRWAWALLLLPLISLQEVRPGSTETAYERARQLFVHGYLEKSQLEAERGFRRSLQFEPALAAKFQLLEAQAMLWRGLSEDALSVLTSWAPSDSDQDRFIRERTLEGSALNHLQEQSEANRRFDEAANLCARAMHPSCGDLLGARGASSIAQGDFSAAKEYLRGSLAVARGYHDQFAEATAFLNLGVDAVQSEHFDEAVDWSTFAYKTAVSIGAQDLSQNALGNLGWAYFKLGDSEKGLDLFVEAERSAVILGDASDEIKWLANAGYVYQAIGNLNQSSRYYQQALTRARDIKSKEEMITSLEDLAHVSIETGKEDDARSYIGELKPLVDASGNRLDALDVMLAEGQIDTIERRDHDAETIMRAVEHDPAAQTSMKLFAEHAIAEIYERRGDDPNAEEMYRSALDTFESSREQLKTEDSKLPFAANATGFYDGYIHFLVERGRAEEALRVADESRAQTLAQGLGIKTKGSAFTVSAFHPTEIARKRGATLLFYWLGQRESYLWALSANKNELFKLPPAQEIAKSIKRYNKTLLGFTDPLARLDADGVALYRTLVVPAATVIQPNANVVILCDGELSQLNFETLIVAGPHPHYWIEDVSVVSAPSLHLLASSKGAEPQSRKLLLLGDVVSPNADYPELPMAVTEMKQIEEHFESGETTVYARDRANAAAYLDSNPSQFAYIHFVAHGVASRTDPLDSAIILSRSSAVEDSFKLHARDIIQHPIRARLVTVSSCYGTGTRSYVGEGPVGLVWAFLRAGAHNVIGALWEVSDQSTSEMMGNLYQGVERGLTPGQALRQAKLALLHSPREFRKPFYWAPLQIYTGL